MRWLVVLLAGCSFHPPGGASDAVVLGDDDASDGDTALPEAAPFEDAPRITCADDSHLRACYQFDGDLVDNSRNDNTATATTPLVFVDGDDGKAIATAGSNIVVADSQTLDVNKLTIRATVKLDRVPSMSDTRQCIVESNAYRLFVQPGGSVRCALNDGSIEVITATALTANDFIRVSCTYNGTALRVFFDGLQKGATAATTSIDAVTTQTTIGQSEPPGMGQNLDGAIDHLEIWDDAVAP